MQQERVANRGALRSRTGSARALRWAWRILLPATLAVAALWLPPVRHQVRRIRELHAEAGFSGIRIAAVADPERIRLGPRAGSGMAVHRYDPPGDPLGVIVLVHGNRSRGSRAPLYRLLATEWRDLGFRVYGVDLEGFGASAPLVTGGDLAQQLAASLGQVLDDLEERERDLPLCLFGHSLGARLVLRAAPGPRWRVVAFEPGGILNGAQGESRRLAALKEHLEGNLRTTSPGLPDVEALYAQTPDSRAALQGRAAVLHGSWGSPARRTAVVDFARATTGRAPVWLPNHDHDLNVMALDGYVLYPGPAVDALVHAVVRECDLPATGAHAAAP